jgi:hypothetical protein
VWAGAYQFAAGASLAIGVVGVVHTGRDVWLGVALIVLAALFGVHGVTLEAAERKRDESEMLKSLAELKERPRVAASDAPGRLRAWLRRRLG